MKILYVEDHELYRRTLTRLATRLGHDLVTADTGEAGYLLAKTPPDLIFLDINLPDCNGLDLARRLRAENVTAPIVIVTGDSVNYNRADALSAGCTEFLTKPFEASEVEQTIQRYAVGDASGTVK